MKCPRCGGTKTKPLDSDDLGRVLFGSGSLRCEACDYLVLKCAMNQDSKMSRSDLEALHEKGERFMRAWYTEQSITRILRGW